MEHMEVFLKFTPFMGNVNNINMYIYNKMWVVCGFTSNAGFRSQRATPNPHPFLDGIFHEINHPAIGDQDEGSHEGSHRTIHPQLWPN